MTELSGNTPDLNRQLDLLRDAYGRRPEDETRRYAYVLESLARLWVSLPDRRRPDTILSIFGRTYDENFLSSYLAYVIDPARNGIGPEPLRRLLEMAGADPQAADLEIAITREYDLGRYGRIDLLIKLGDQIVLGLENKVLAAEGTSQTTSYAEAIARKFPGRAHYFLFLTRDGQRGSSRKFVPLSYRQLLDGFAAIRYDWPADVKKSVLWEDFLEHLRAYIAMGEDMVELSEKAKLYIENYKMIKDLTKAFEREADAFFTYFQNSLAAGLSADEWKISFYSTRVYQQVYRPSWVLPDLWVHYEYSLSREVLVQDSFAFMIDVEKSMMTYFSISSSRATTSSRIDSNSLASPTGRTSAPMPWPGRPTRWMESRRTSFSSCCWLSMNSPS